MSEQAAASEPSTWQVPAIDGSDGKGYLTAGRLEQLQKDAYDEAWQKGFAEGQAKGEFAVAQRAARYDELLRSLCRPFEQMDETIEKQLVELSIAVVKQLFRRERKIEPTHVIGVVREAIQLLPVASNNVQVHLHTSAQQGNDIAPIYVMGGWPSNGWETTPGQNYFSAPSRQLIK